jgi:dynein heavy chain
MNYDKVFDEFMIIWRDTNEAGKLKRIYICLDAEDPRKYMQRMKNAFQQRIYADSIIRYNFTIDNMPIINADLPDLDQEQRKRLEMLARTPKKLKDVDVSGILFEVGYDFNRTMNKIIFDEQLANETIENLPRLELPPDEDKVETRETGMMPLERLKEGAKNLIITGREITFETPRPFS